MPPDDSTALVVASRTDFDGALLAAAIHAGAHFSNARVSDVRADDGAGFVLVTSDGRLATSFLVGADGANSLVRRKVSAPFRRNNSQAARPRPPNPITNTSLSVKSSICSSVSDPCSVLGIIIFTSSDFQSAQSNHRKQHTEDVKPHYHLGFVPTLLFEMMMYRRHQKNPAASAVTPFRVFEPPGL